MSAIAVRAPGRVNLIGEHTDYNDGFVMPAAIGYYTTVEASPRDDRILEIASDSQTGSLTIALDDVAMQRRGDWRDYAAGVAIELERAGAVLRGATLHASSTIPFGAGLSSSASFEVALALAMLDVSGASLDRIAIVRACQRADNEHVGVRSGIMDQFCVLFAREGCAVMLDTRSLESRYVAIPQPASIVICNTMLEHRLASGAYNRRRAECDQAVRLLQRPYPGVRALRDVSMEQLDACRASLPKTLYRRARHVVAENARVLEAAGALEAGDLARCGALMDRSHESLREDYQVSCKELDVMVGIARDCDGVYGARMTGGGFGGCTVNLVAKDAREAFCERIVKEYRTATAMTPEIYDGTPVDAAA